MTRILIAYSSTDGHTLEICLRLQEIIVRQAHLAKVVSIADEPDIDIMPYDKVVIGASIRYGKHRTHVYEFVRLNEKILDSKPNAFFSVNVVARKPEKSRPETNPYLKKFLKQSSWQPKALAVFAGKIDYKKYRFWDRQMIRIIMWMTKGPTDPNTIVDFTDWKQVENFGLTVCNM